LAEIRIAGLVLFREICFHFGMSRPIETLRLSQLLPLVRESFDQIPEWRQDAAAALTYPLADVLMSGLAMMLVQDPSMLEFQRRLH